MGGLFGGNKKQEPAPAPVAPTVDNSQAKLDAASEAQRQAALRGRSSTILTSGQGVSDMGTTTKTMLGQ